MIIDRASFNIQTRGKAPSPPCLPLQLQPFTVFCPPSLWSLFHFAVLKFLFRPFAAFLLNRICFSFQYSTHKNRRNLQKCFNILGSWLSSKYRCMKPSWCYEFSDVRNRYLAHPAPWSMFLSTKCLSSPYRFFLMKLVYKKLVLRWPKF